MIRCDGVKRRDFIQVGSLTALGAGLATQLEQQATASSTLGKARACILIWLDGGPSHLETFDPKPDAPIEIRGPMTSVATSIPGIRLNECFEKTAKLMGDLAIIRSMTSPLGEHNFGTHYMMTGYKPSAALEYPSIGSCLAHLRRSDHVLPAFVSATGFTDAIRGNGYLPQATAPFVIGKNYQVPNLGFFPGLDLERIHSRRKILQRLNKFSKFRDRVADDSNANSVMQQAYALIASAEAKQAFDIAQESEQTHQRYGRGGTFGKGCLLARRLIERGVTFVTLNFKGWDTHQKIHQLKERFPGDRGASLPSLDRALSGLITDLKERNLLEQTLVMVMGEFGRTPKINAQGGRDHWPNVFSVALAGGGIQGGQVIGQSDSLGELPHETPVTPSDLAATAYTLLGCDPKQELKTPDGRPVRLVPNAARVVQELVG